MQGSLHTKTVRAFTEDEFRKITAVLPEIDRTRRSRRLRLVERYECPDEEI